MLGLFALAVFAARDINLENVGFNFASSRVFLGWCLALAIGSAAIGGLFHWLRVHGRLQPGPGGSYLIPQTRPQKLACVLLLAPSVGFCEELVYRSYLLAEIPHWLKGCPIAATLFLACLLFGLAHINQGRVGVLQTILLGALWSWPVMHSGTLYPSMTIHAIYDAVVLAWVGPIDVRRAKAPLAAML